MNRTGKFAFFSSPQASAAAAARPWKGFPTTTLFAGFLALAGVLPGPVQAGPVITIGPTAVVGQADETATFGIPDFTSISNYSQGGINIFTAGAQNYSSFDPTYGASTANSFDADASLLANNSYYPAHGSPSSTNISIISGASFYALSADFGNGHGRPNFIAYEGSDGTNTFSGIVTAPIGSSILFTGTMSYLDLFDEEDLNSAEIALTNGFDPILDQSSSVTNAIAIGGLEIQNDAPASNSPEPSTMAIGVSGIMLWAGTAVLRRGRLAVIWRKV